MTGRTGLPKFFVKIEKSNKEIVLNEMKTLQHNKCSLRLSHCSGQQVNFLKLVYFF